MKLRHSLGIPIAAAAVAVMGWLALREDPRPAPETQQPGASAKAGERPGARTGGGSVVGKASAPAAFSRGPGTAVAQRPPGAFDDFLKAKEYRALYDRLRNSAEGESAEGRLVLWEILRNCATVTEGRRYSYRPPLPKREEFIAGVNANDPQREQRIAAYDAFVTNRCQGFEGVAIAQADLDKMLAASAAAGDPRAKALSLEQELWMARRAQGRDSVVLSDNQVETLKQLANTKDPEAIRVAGRVMANAWADTSIRLGPDQQPVEQRAFMNAWLVLACEFGQPCGSDTPRLQQACALQGHCNAQTYPDYLYYYSSSPHESQLLAQYRSVLRNAIDTGDWSQLSIVRGVPTPPGRITFVPGPR
jgi:hypothetical protein